MQTCIQSHKKYLTKKKEKTQILYSSNDESESFAKSFFFIKFH